MPTTAYDLMQMSAEKAVGELSWESIEFLFAPRTAFELLLRYDFHGMIDKVAEWAADNSPEAMPHRHRGPYLKTMNDCIKVEEFYRAMKAEREKQCQCSNQTQT